MDISTKKFLVVDDSQMIRSVIGKALKEIGVLQVDNAANGQEALEKLEISYAEGDPYSMMTLDWEMPVMPGLELLKLVRADPRMKELSVLMVSAHSQPHHHETLAPFKPNGFVVKPFENDFLKEQIVLLLTEI